MKYIWNNSYIWTAVVDQSEEMIIAVNFPIKAIGKKKPEKNQGFNGIRTRDLRDTGAMLYQLSSEGARPIYWVHIFSSSETMWSLYEIIRICTAVVDESEEGSSQ